MTAQADILDQQERLRGAFGAALALHVGLAGAALLYSWIHGRTESFGDKNAGAGAIGIQAVDAIPLVHRGEPNPVANDTESLVPKEQAKPEPKQRAKDKVEPPDPTAVRLKSKNAKKQPQAAVPPPRFRSFKEVEANQLKARQNPAVANPAYSALPGAGNIGAGANTTLGDRFAGYGAQIRQLVAQKWRTGEVPANIRSAPMVVATFELMRDGSVRNVRILQRSGIALLDYSVERAIEEASPFPPIPPGFDRDRATVEFWFELKR